uniref:Cyclic nucleotide-binding domain-containing protein n=1 Tax=Phaeomonas parva TaxID=124430 RepID=A0A7S1XSX4_9STRA
MARKNLAEYKEAETKRWRALASLSQAQAAKKKRSASKDSIDDRSVASGAEQGGAAEGEGKDGGDGDAGDGTGNDTTGNSDSKNNGEDGENASPSKEEYPHHAHVAKSKKELLFARCGECDKIKLHFQLKSELIFLAQENAQYMLDRINGRLEKQEFFEHIGLPFVAPLAVERDFASGAVLAREDTSAKEIMFIFEGECSQEKKIVNNRVEKIKKRQREPTFSADSHDMGDDGLADNDEPHEPHKNKSGEHAFDYTSGGKGRLRKKTKVQAPPNSEILLPSGFKFAIKKCQLSLLGPQAIIGDISAVMNAPHPTTVQAMCDVRVFSVPIRAFKESLLPYPGIRQALRVSAKTKAKRIDHVVRSFVKGQGPRRDDDARRRGRGFKPLLEPESPTSLVLNPDANKAEQGLEPAPSEPKPRPKRMAKAKSRLDRRKSYLEVEEERPKTVVPVVVERVTTGKLRVAADVYEIRNRAYVQRGLEVKSNLQPPGKSQRGAKAEAAAKDAEDAEDAEDTEDAEDAEDEEDAEGLETPQRKAWAELELIAQSVRRGSLLDGKLQDLGSRPAVMSQTAPAALKGDANPPTTKPTEPTPDADDDVTALSGTQSTPHRANFVIDVPTPHGDFKGSAGSNSGFDIGDSITSAGEAPPPIIENDLEELASLQAGEAAEQQLAPEALGEAARWKAVPAAAAEAPSASAPPGAQPLTAGAEEAGEEASTSGEPPDKLEKSKSTITFAKRFLKDAYGRITGQDLLHAGELGAGKRSLILDIMINNAGLLVEGPQYSGLGDGRSKLGGDFEAKEAQKALEELVQEMVMRRRKNLEVEPVPTITCDRRLHGRSLPTVRHSDGYENPWLQ